MWGAESLADSPDAAHYRLRWKPPLSTIDPPGPAAALTPSERRYVDGATESLVGSSSTAPDHGAVSTHPARYSRAFLREGTQ